MDKLFKQALRFQQFLQTLLGQTPSPNPRPDPQALHCWHPVATNRGLQTNHKKGKIHAGQKSPSKPPKTAYITELLEFQSLASYLKSEKTNYTVR